MGRMTALTPQLVVLTTGERPLIARSKSHPSRALPLSFADRS